jgi:hypothetical protein
MDRKYHCPKCKALLNVREYIVFVANSVVEMFGDDAAEYKKFWGEGPGY